MRVACDQAWNLTHFEEAYTSKRKMIRIYKVLDVDLEVSNPHLVLTKAS